MTDPTVARRDDLVEVLHGTEVADPYRWMEDLGSDELARWVAAVGDEARAALDDLPGRDVLAASVAAAMDVPRSGAPWSRGGRWFQLRNTGLQDHDVLWTASDTADDGTAPTDGWHVLLDPDDWGGAASLGPVAVAPGGDLLAYAVSEAGSDWQTWRVRDVTTGADLPDEVAWSKFGGAGWLPDGSGFLTTTYPAPDEGRTHEAATLGQQVVRHDLGGETRVVHQLRDEPEAVLDVEISHDGRWLVLTVTRGTDPTSRVQVAPLDGRTIGDVRWLVEEATALWRPVGVVGDELVAVTDEDAPRRRVVALPLDGGDAREVLPESDDLLEVARIAGAQDPDDPGWLVTSHLRDAASVVRVHDLDGTTLHEVPLDGLVTVGDQHIGGELRTSRSSSVVHVVATSFARPSDLRRHDAATGTTTSLDPVCAPTDVAVDAAAMHVERVFVTSDDVRVPVFVLHRPDVAPNGATPAILWGYGGFDIAITPHFRPAWQAWVEHGGVVAVACLRGGSEYGRAWADDGRRRNKQHVFDDALAVAAWLCGEGTAHDGRGREAVELDQPAWTSSDQLGVEGRSNGGLLAAACLVQAPDRFASAVPEVGVLDALRFHRFTIGWAWTSDYGDPEDPDDFHAALAWSPLHNLVTGRPYPPTLVTTADTDDRVVPSHSFKFAAALRHAQGSDAPVLLRVDRAAGHGAGKPTSQLIEERVDVLAWHAHHLGLWPDNT